MTKAQTASGTAHRASSVGSISCPYVEFTKPVIRRMEPIAMKQSSPKKRPTVSDDAA